MSGEGSDEKETDSNFMPLSKRKKYIDTLLDHWWRRWRDDYLIELREHHKSHSKKRGLNPKIGDIVLIADDKLKRSEWKVGRITKLVLSRDDKIRSAELLTKNKKTCFTSTN